MKKILVNIFIPIFIFLGSGRLSADNELVVKAFKPSFLYKGPGETYGRTDEKVQQAEALLVLGISVGKKWYRVIRASGYGGWIPISRVEAVPVSSEEAHELRTMLQLKRRITSRFIGQIGGTYGSHPLSYGGRFMFLTNLTRVGVVGKKVDQLEVGLGVGYHYYKKDPFFEIPFTLQWIFRPPASNSFMLGPKVGVTIMKDPEFSHDWALPIETGLHMRLFFNDTTGIFLEGSVLVRSIVYYMGTFGLVSRF